jgi:F-type H+-transporting ATPase subunit delta
MPLVNKRYAEALIKITEENNTTKGVLSDFAEVVKVLEENKELKLFFLNPHVKISDKKDVLKELFEGKISIELLNLLKLIVDKDRIKYIPGILDEYSKLYDENRNVLNLKISSAVPLEEMQINSIKQTYLRLYDKSSAKVKLEIDEKLIGGVRVQIGDKVIDGSIKGRLESMMEIMMK